MEPADTSSVPWGMADSLCLWYDAAKTGPLCIFKPLNVIMLIPTTFCARISVSVMIPHENYSSHLS